MTGGLLGARTLGLVGYGRVGRRVASIVRPTGAKVIACDPHLTSADVPLVPLDELLKASDVVSLHSVGGSVRLGSREFALMRKGAILINTARGDLVDESALIEALKSGHLAGAGLDVFETEPYKGPLASIDTAVLTAHMGSYAAETRAEQEREALFNLVADLKGCRSVGVMQSRHAVFFDFDGVIADSVDVKTAAFCRALFRARAGGDGEGRGLSPDPSRHDALSENRVFSARAGGRPGR